MKRQENVDISELIEKGEMDGIEAFDWKEISESAITRLDGMLAEHGLEIELLDNGSDTYLLRVVKKEEGTDA